MSISRKIRFEVFKRDLFTCQYCGRKPPDVILEADHITPKSKDGDDDINNLVTSCFDCNRGKGKNSLDVIPTSIYENLETIKEKQEQLGEYNKILKKLKTRETKNINKIDKIYNSYFTQYTLAEIFKRGTLRNFTKMLPMVEIEDAMEIACSKFRNEETGSSQAIKYFCGICWNKINSRN